MRPPKIKKAYAIFAALILSIAGFAVFGDNGLSDLLKFKKEKNKLQAEHKSLVVENAALSRDIKLLKEDKRFIEKTAREELGMVGKNEVIYVRKEK